MNTYTAINLVKRPQGGPITSDIFEVVQKPIPVVKPGELLIKQNHMSLDPAMFGWMQPDTDSYIPPVNLGDVMRSSGVGEVVESNHPDFKAGDRVMGMMGWQEYFLTDGKGINKVDAPLPDEAILSIFALPGLTATQGLFNVGKPKSGETIIVTGAAGSVGSIVGQLAKADGLHVIGVVGSDEKADWIVNELGFDSAINYKTADLAAELDKLAPQGIDLFFENTAGPIQSLIVDRMNPHGRVMVCGLIADYSKQTPAPGPSWMNILKRRITVQGFTMPDHFGEVPSLLEKLTPYVLKGQIKHRSHVLEGLESSIEGLNLFFTGENKGKLMVKL
ncbi:NADP-dependent oxidoreductase [Shewanella sp. KT0246]|uniref:NADP-dependent oxidoreductase n=1 Tax=Shewanella sp. KT0246 TaxID=2815912 RepID=UPI001BC484E9|nr:NADP-dependent oxidoreductase [Shewanella sp. KT0246]GIU53155.1 NADP-dependent oxidoreductase [Shewanella sp. KT0246]